MIIVHLWLLLFNACAVRQWQMICALTLQEDTLLSLSLSLFLHLHTEPRPRLMLSFRCRGDRGPIITCFHGSYDSASREAILQTLVFLFISCVGQRRLSSFPPAPELPGLLKHHNSAAFSMEASCTCTAMQQLIDNHCLPLKVKHAPPDNRRPLGCRIFFSALEFHGGGTWCSD